MLEFDRVTKTFTARGTRIDALAATSFTVARGEFVALVGPSGCGKSTLLNLAAGIMTASAGEVRHGGHRVEGVNRDVGYMTQADALLPWRTAEANVMLPLLLHGVRAREARERARAELARVGLAGFARHYPAELSGGMRKRVALAQLLVAGPGTWLLDEPFGALDAQLRLLLAQALAAEHARAGATVLFVTHDLGEAIALADRVLVFTGRPGRVKLVAPVTLPRPRDLFALRVDPDFQALHARLWDALAPEIRPEAA